MTKMSEQYHSPSCAASPLSIVSNISMSSNLSDDGGGSAYNPSSKNGFSNSYFKIESSKNNIAGIASSSIAVKKVQQPIYDDGLFNVSITHVIAGKMDAPRNSSFGKLDIFNFNGALMDTDVEDAIAHSNLLLSIFNRGGRYSSYSYISSLAYLYRSFG